MLPLCYQSIYPSSSLLHRGCVITAVTSWCRLCCCIVMVSSLLWRCHLCISCGFVVAIAVSPLLSHHHGVIVTVVLLWCRFCCCCYSVTFIVILSWFCCHCCGVTFVSVTVSLLPLQCRLHVGCGFVITVAMSPSCWLWFHHCHHGVAFVVASSWCHRCSHIVMVPSLSHCRGFVITIVVSPSSSHHHSFIVAVSLLQSCHCGAFAVTSLQFYCHHRCYHHRLALHLDAKREEPKIPEKPKILSGL